MINLNLARSQSSEIARKQYQEMRQNYAKALEALEQVDTLLNANAYDRAVVPLGEAIELKGKLEQTELPSVVKRAVTNWNARIVAHKQEITKAGVKLPDWSAHEKRTAPLGRSRLDSRGDLVQHLVTVTCSTSELVQRQNLIVVHYPDKPIPKQSEARLSSDKLVFGEDGSCSVELPAGTFSFNVLYQRDDGTIVALTSGKHEITQEAAVPLDASPPKEVTLLYKNAELPLKNVMARIEGTMYLEVWNGSRPGDAPKLVLSPKHGFPLRLWSQSESDAAVVWVHVRGDEPKVEISSDWYTECTFRVLDGQPPYGKAGITFFLPEARRGVGGGYEGLYKGQCPEDLLHLPLNDKSRLITNRRFVEAWYEYETKASERVSFARQPYALTENQHVFFWGGALSITASARQGSSWKGTGRALIWGANLNNASGHQVNTPETGVGLPGDTHTPAPADIQWCQRLQRRDGKSLTLGVPEKQRTGKNARFNGERTDADFDVEEFASEESFPELFARPFPKEPPFKHGVSQDVSDMFQVEVSYKLNGERVEEVVLCEPWVRYTSTHGTFEAPKGVSGLAFVWLDRLNRTVLHGKAYPGGNFQLEMIRMRWNGNQWSGVSWRGRISNSYLGCATFRRRRSIYGCDWGPAHEWMHSWGYSHGSAHNLAISKTRRGYLTHHIYLADHPEYAAEPMTIEAAGG